MKKIKKMVLIDYEDFAPNQKPQLQENKDNQIDLYTGPKPLRFLDHEMQKVLMSDDIPSDKLKKYMYALNRFQFFKNHNEVEPDLEVIRKRKLKKLKSFDNHDQSDDELFDDANSFNTTLNYEKPAFDLEDYLNDNTKPEKVSIETKSKLLPWLTLN